MDSFLRGFADELIKTAGFGGLSGSARLEARELLEAIRSRGARAERKARELIRRPREGTVIPAGVPIRRIPARGMTESALTAVPSEDLSYIDRGTKPDAGGRGRSR